MFHQRQRLPVGANEDMLAVIQVRARAIGQSDLQRAGPASEFACGLENRDLVAGLDGAGGGNGRVNSA